MRRLFVLGFFLMALSMPRLGLASEMTHFLHIPSTLNGPSGLILTQSIDTLPPKKYGMGLGFSMEESDNPKFTETQAIFTGIMGLSQTLEASVQIPYFTEVQRPNRKSESGMGDVSVSLKWRFMDASPSLNFPGFALSLSVFLPTGDAENGVGTVDVWGLKALIVSSAEALITLPFGTTLMGFYANGGVYIQDSGDPTEEKHGILDIGILLPLNNTKRIQLLLEGNARMRREKRGFNPPDAEYRAGTVGLRYIRKNMIFTAALQHRLNGLNDDTDIFLFHGAYGF